MEIVDGEYDKNGELISCSMVYENIADIIMEYIFYNKGENEKGLFELFYIPDKEDRKELTDVLYKLKETGLIVFKEKKWYSTMLGVKHVKKYEEQLSKAMKAEERRNKK